MAVTLGTPLTQFPGVGEVRAKKLEKLGLSTAADLLAYYPRDYEDRRQMYTVRDAPLEGRVCIAAMAAEHVRRMHGIFLRHWDTARQTAEYRASPRAKRVLWNIYARCPLAASVLVHVYGRMKG